MPTLKVDIKITPHPTTIPSEKLDELLNGELGEFERHFIARQRAGGLLNPSPLITGERSLIKAYILYAATKETV